MEPAKDKNEFTRTHLLPVSHGSDGDRECPICADSYVDPILENFQNKVPVRIANCGHVFCHSCLLRMIESDAESRNRCPLCRTVLFHLTAPVPALHIASPAQQPSMTITTAESTAPTISPGRPIIDAPSINTGAPVRLAAETRTANSSLPTQPTNSAVASSLTHQPQEEEVVPLVHNVVPSSSTNTGTISNATSMSRLQAGHAIPELRTFEDVERELHVIAHYSYFRNYGISRDEQLAEVADRQQRVIEALSRLYGRRVTKVRYFEGYW